MTDPQALAGGRYLLVQRLGEGGMATVYRAFDQRLQVWRAVKVMLPEYARKKKILARFETEAQTMALLEHPHIVRVYDVDRDGDHVYIVMELVEGGSLVDWLESHGTMPARVAVDVIVEVCQALQFAHGKGVVHRDIKPHNIMVDRDGTCRLTDFGIARAGDTEDSLTKTGAVMGTWGYMAPEQRTDAKHVDERADVYALAATLYSLLTDKTPMDLFAVDHDATMLHGVPEPLRPILVQATEYKKENRYAAAADLAAALLSVRDELEPVPEDTPSLVRTIEPPPPVPSLASVSSPTAEPPAAPMPVSPPPANAGATLLPDDPEISGQFTMPPSADEGIEPAPQQRAVYEPGDDALHDDPEPSLLGAPPRKRNALPLVIGVLALAGVGVWALWGTPLPAPAPAPVAIAPSVADDDAAKAATVEPADEGTAQAEPAADVVAEAPERAARPVRRPAPTPDPAGTPDPEPEPASDPEPEAPATVREPEPPRDAPARMPRVEDFAAEPEPVADPGGTPDAEPDSQCFEVVDVPRTVTMGETLAFKARMCLKGSVVLHYRAQGGGTWFQKEMALIVGNYSAVVPVSEIFAGGIEWYIVAEDIQHGSASSPKRTKVK